MVRGGKQTKNPICKGPTCLLQNSIKHCRDPSLFITPHCCSLTSCRGPEGPQVLHRHTGSVQTLTASLPAGASSDLTSKAMTYQFPQSHFSIATHHTGEPGEPLPKG